RFHGGARSPSSQSPPACRTTFRQSFRRQRCQGGQKGAFRQRAGPVREKAPRQGRGYVWGQWRKACPGTVLSPRPGATCRKMLLGSTRRSFVFIGKSLGCGDQLTG